MVGFEVNKAKLKALEQNFDKFASSLNYRKPLTRSVEILRYEQKRNFEQQGREYGFWKALSVSTRKDRARQGYNPARPILQRRGDLKNGFRSYVYTNYAKVVNVVEYAVYHQFGTKYMPARMIVKKTKKNVQAIGLTFSQFIAGHIKQYFYR
jgi:phage gpG-like protein